MSEPRLHIGAVVHYVSRGSADGEYTRECRAATVTAIGDDDTASLAVLNPSGMFFTEHLPYHGAEQAPGGTWHWPETA